MDDIAALVNALGETMGKHNLSDLSLVREGLKVRIRRGTVAAAQPPAGTASLPLNGAGLQVVKSPVAGVWYSRESDSAPFVREGSRVEAQTVVGLVEDDSKVFNEIQAECSGTVARVLVVNGAPVTRGTPLVEVGP